MLREPTTQTLNVVDTIVKLERELTGSRKPSVDVGVTLKKRRCWKMVDVEETLMLEEGRCWRKVGSEEKCAGEIRYTLVRVRKLLLNVSCT
jgi:hypothetical protein